MKTLVTGISGYVGAHVALALLKGDRHQVVGIVRDDKQKTRLEEEETFIPYVRRGALTFCIVPNICSESEALDTAMQGIECVHHLASPYHYTGKDAEQEYLRPAIDATMTVMKAATKTSPPVSSFVLLSSFAAVLSPGDCHYSSKTYTEENWNCISYEMAKTPANPGLGYMGSKKYAELAAYEYQQLHAPDLRLVSLLPPVILGPAVGKQLSVRVASSQSFCELFSFLQQGKKEQLSPSGVPVYADVRQVALAHRKAMENNEAKGRYLVSNGQWDWQRLADICHDRLGMQQRGQRGNYSSTANESKALYNLDTSKSAVILGIQGKDTFEELMCGDGGMVQQALSWLEQLPKAPSSLETSTYLGSYLFDSIHRLNTATIFGVPGDFNFGLCDLIDEDERFTWGGNTTELGAAYAADGYARTNQSSPGVILTTWAVGELSALNGIMGAFAERIPIVHIVGLPPRIQAQRKIPIHHSLANGDYQVYERIAKEAHCIVEVLDGNVDTDLDKIDTVLATVMKERRPGYIGVPADCVFLPITSKAIQSRFQVPAAPILSITSQASLQKTLDRLFAAHRPAIIYDAHITRKGLEEEARQSASLLPRHIRYFVSPLAKGIVNEDCDQFGGMFIGALSEAKVVKTLVEESDLIVRIGFLQLDTNAGAFSARFSAEQIIEIGEDEVASFLEAFTKRLEEFKIEKPAAPSVKLSNGKRRREEDYKHMNGTPDGCNALSHSSVKSPLISQADFWFLLENFLRPNDVVVAEIGTASFGILDVSLLPRTRVLTQLQFNSIGWSVGAALGACMSLRDSIRLNCDQKGRIVLLVGDGSLQMTVSELSTFIRNGLKPVILVLNNNGYTIERVFHAPRRTYNDVQPWSYRDVIKSFDGEDSSSKNLFTAIAETKDELEETLADVKDNVLTLVDVKMSSTSAPRILQVARAGSTATNPNNYAPEFRW